MLDWSRPCFFLSLPFEKLGLNWEELLAICPKKGYLVLQEQGLLNGASDSDFLKRFMLKRPDWTVCAFDSEHQRFRMRLPSFLKRISANDLAQMLQKSPHCLQLIPRKV